VFQRAPKRFLKGIGVGSSTHTCKDEECGGRDEESPGEFVVDARHPTSLLSAFPGLLTADGQYINPSLPTLRLTTYFTSYTDESHRHGQSEEPRKRWLAPSQ
jgi:hypothetical protein